MAHTQRHKDHHHDDHHNHEGLGHHHHGGDNISMAFWMNLIFTVIEVIGGLWTNSIAILSDAVHDLGDSIALLFSMIMEKKSRKKGNRNLTFGYKRYSLLGAFVSSFILILGSTFIIYNAVGRLFSVEEVHASGMAGMAVLGILFNGLAVLRLRKDDSLNAKVVFMHLLEDVLGWASILVVSIIMIFIDLPILDPILSIVIAVFVLSRIIPTLMKIGRIFLQYKPDGHEVQDIRIALEADSQVTDIHDIHLWSLDGTNHVFSCHVLVEDSLNMEDISALRNRLKQILEQRGISHSTLEVENNRENCTPCDE